MSSWLYIRFLFRIGITEEICKREYLEEIKNIDHTKDVKNIININKKLEEIRNRTHSSHNRKNIECASSISLLEGVYYHNGYPCGVDACLKNDYQPVGIQSCGIPINNAHDSKRYVVASPSRTYYAYCAKATNNRIKRKEEEKNKMKNAAKVILLN